MSTSPRSSSNRARHWLSSAILRRWWRGSEARRRIRRSRAMFDGSLVWWLVECWFAVRVAIDASLFRHLAGEREDRWRRLDELVASWGLGKTAQGRSAADRSRGAMALWRMQAITLTIQLVLLIAAVLLQVVGL